MCCSVMRALSLLMETNHLKSGSQGVKNPVTDCDIKSKYGAFSDERLKYGGAE